MKRFLILTLLVLAIVLTLASCGEKEHIKKTTKNPTNPPFGSANGILLEVMPNGGDFKVVDSDDKELPATIKKVYKASNGGYVFKVEFTGFNPGNVAIIGVDAEGKITGTKVITNTETSGYGDDILPKLDGKGHYNGSTLDTIDGVDTVSGCTISTKAYRAVVKDALSAAAIISGSN